jgi:hypothetical protein
MFGGKRELLARVLCRLGLPFAFERLPPRDVLVVLNYHRIGDPREDPYDSGVFSATPAEFDQQLSALRHAGVLVSPQAALAFVEGRETDSPPCYRVLITFDDGYLDNYQLAFPVLRSHGAEAVFFCAPGWWAPAACPGGTASPSW